MLWIMVLTTVPSDQGLVYYWAKYIEQNVTLLIGDTFENWGPSNTSGRPVLEKSFPAPFDDRGGFSSKKDYKTDFRCPTGNNNFQGKNTAFCHEPVRSLHHFYGKRKPWTIARPNDVKSKRDATRIFFVYLDQINTKYGLDLDMDHWDDERAKIRSSPLGSSNDFSFWGDLGRRIQRRTPYLLQRARELNIEMQDTTTV